jgi:hypothetical protein
MKNGENHTLRVLSLSKHCLRGLYDKTILTSFPDARARAECALSLSL